MSEQTTSIPEKVRGFRRRVFPPAAIDLTIPSAEAEALFMESVSKANGEVGVLVHPYFRGGWGSLYPLTDQYRQQVDSFVADVEVKGIPLVVFEEQKKIGTLPFSFPRTTTPVFTIATIKNNPAPALPHIPPRDEGDIDPEVTREALDGVSARFSSYGVKHVAIGGRYLFADRGIAYNRDIYREFADPISHLATARRWIDHNLYPNGCVGAVIKSLYRNNIETDVIEAVGPSVLPSDLFVA